MPPKTPAKRRRTSKASLVGSNTPSTTDEPPAHAMSETGVQFSTSYPQKRTWQLMSSARATSSPPATLTTPALLSKANLDHAMATVTPQSVQENLARSFRSPAPSQVSVASVGQASNAENMPPTQRAPLTANFASTGSTISFGGRTSVSPADSASNVTHHLSAEDMFKREEAYKKNLREENMEWITPRMLDQTLFVQAFYEALKLPLHYQDMWNKANAALRRSVDIAEYETQLMHLHHRYRGHLVKTARDNLHIIYNFGKMSREAIAEKVAKLLHEERFIYAEKDRNKADLTTVVSSFEAHEIETLTWIQYFQTTKRLGTKNQATFMQSINANYIALLCTVLRHALCEWRKGYKETPIVFKYDNCFVYYKAYLDALDIAGDAFVKACASTISTSIEARQRAAGMNTPPPPLLTAPSINLGDVNSRVAAMNARLKERMEVSSGLFDDASGSDSPADSVDLPEVAIHVDTSCVSESLVSESCVETLMPSSTHYTPSPSSVLLGAATALQSYARPPTSSVGQSALAQSLLDDEATEVDSPMTES